jgi:Tfp pilus assembly protein PilF
MAARHDEGAVMPELDKLLKKLRTAEKKGDLDGLDKVREQIVAEHVDAPEAVEARYKLGLSRLLRHKDAAGAEELFKAAAAATDPLYSAMARISLALMLHAQKKEQKALFELRKVVGSRKPTTQSVLALAFIVTILKDMGSKPDEVQRARAQQIEHLKAVLDGTEDAVEQASLLVQLGLALFDQRDSAQSKQVLQRVLALGDAVYNDLRAAAEATLSAIG